MLHASILVSLNMLLCATPPVAQCPHHNTYQAIRKTIPRHPGFSRFSPVNVLPKAASASMAGEGCTLAWLQNRFGPVWNQSSIEA